MSKTHWKKLYNPNYMGAYSFLENETKELRIKAIKSEKVTGQDGKAEDCTVLHWEGSEKPLILNKTNAKAIAHLTGSNYIEDWTGVVIALHVKEVRAFGSVVDAVRVSMKKPKQSEPVKEFFDESHANWQKALKAVASGSYKVEAITAKYQVGKTALETLKKAENEAV